MAHDIESLLPLCLPIPDTIQPKESSTGIVFPMIRQQSASPGKWKYKDDNGISCEAGAGDGDRICRHRIGTKSILLPTMPVVMI
jgi:hypothetical protein